MHRKIKKLLTSGIVLGLCAQLACTQSGETDERSEVLARVNGEAITQAQLNAHIETLFGKKQVQNKRLEAERRKLLESMVMSRLIKQQAEKTLNPAQKKAYEQKARMYREKIIVNDYLRENLNPEPVSSEMLTQYYNKHPQKFGAVQKMHYELLISPDRLNEPDRNKLLSLYGTQDKTRDLQQMREFLAEKGIHLIYQKKYLNSGVAEKRIQQALAGLQPGVASALFMEQGRAFIVRLLTRTQSDPRPLSEVQDEVRKRLLPIALKKAIKQQSEQLKDSAKIEYLLEND